MTFHEALFQAELPNLLIGSGIVFLIIAVLGEVTGKFKTDRTGRVAAALVGPLLIVVGLFVFLLTPPVGTAVDPAGAEAEVIEPAPAALTAADEATTPPDDVAPVDRPLTETTPAQTTPVPSNPAGVVVEREPNDAALTATLVEGDATATGTIRSATDPDPSMDSDYFAVWLDAGDPISVEVVRESGPGTLYVALLDPNGLSEPSGDWLSDVAVVESRDRVRIEAVAGQTGYHYVLVSGWIYLIDLDLYFNDGGNGAYTVEIETAGRSDRSPAEAEVGSLTTTAGAPDAAFVAVVPRTRASVA